MKINLTAILKSKPENIDELRHILLDMVDKSKSEIACMQYELHQDKNDKSLFIFYEVWENQIGFEQHNQQSYIQSFFQNSKSLLQEEPLLYFTNRLA
ncbi:Antibiotic biosynthesis monooxygenase [Flavobacterium sp. 9R]|uniref:putative quinol monooxygenase n=1 Tax=Flavobacterium sp. 9R TaxID=2653143 RepID=UPI0012F42F2A|nr:putative quinol monooxygenase [Flavobacterium sp. 9R]VXB97547.1 Antibiotic biosynthesis monooxygenase [Flavobacterium sp. 9R]